MKVARIILWALVLVVAAVVAGVYVGRVLVADPNLEASSSVGAAMIRSRYDEAGGPFTLVGLDGKTVTEADLEGKPRAMFFGFTHCPDVCPTAMLDASRWLDALGEDADKINIVFVSVDPERDRPENLKTYLGAFDERIIGLTAEDEDTIRDVADRYHVRFEKVPMSNGSYTMNHTSDTLLFDADGDYAGFIPFIAPNIRQNDKAAAAQEQKAIDTLKALIAS
ncbi:SCO family protein [Acuticoccus mangrovi]|uniref:SCO family protein n=1 Tax=Acuticoccus mangrovi TaxID=2796142 RepID=A0A934MC55_9HYPH|nr:SCO family protein [Acuticoccus mangrovi]MBJ3774897.1 SCO family protein [Acuticoccus mangrovi]